MLRPYLAGRDWNPPKWLGLFNNITCDDMNIISDSSKLISSTAFFWNWTPTNYFYFSRCTQVRSIESLLKSKVNEIDGLKRKRYSFLFYSWYFSATAYVRELEIENEECLAEIRRLRGIVEWKQEPLSKVLNNVSHTPNIASVVAPQVIAGISCYISHK